MDNSRRNNPSFVPIELMANKASPLEFASEADHDDPIDGEGESSESVNSSRYVYSTVFCVNESQYLN